MVRSFQADLNKQLREADGIKPPNNTNLNHPSLCRNLKILGNLESKVHIFPLTFSHQRTVLMWSSEDLRHGLLLSPLICSVKNSHETFFKSQQIVLTKFLVIIS